VLIHAIHLEVIIASQMEMFIITRLATLVDATPEAALVIQVLMKLLCRHVTQLKLAIVESVIIFQ